ncbi:MAG TPA: carbohydrate porin [Geobacteraceae bacterium]
MLAFLCMASMAFAADQSPTTPYSGSVPSRSTLTGDWGGVRNDLANKGVTFDTNLVLTAQGVVDGGGNREWEGGGRGNLLFRVDTGKLGLWPGGFLTAEVEGNFGKGVNLKTRALMPVNSNQVFPIPGDEGVNVPALNFTQFLSEQVGVVAGKLDTMSGDMNEFAHGKGDSQFMNLALNINPTLLLSVPYSTLGTGVIFLPTKDPNDVLITFSAVSAVGSADRAGFNELDGNAMTYALEGRLRTDFFGMTGHQLAGVVYSSKDIVAIDQRLNLAPGSNTIERKPDTKAFYYNFDQYLYEPSKGSGKGLGIFGRFAATDGNPNFMQYFMSLGVGGKGVMANRPHDSFGVGWYYLDINHPSFTGPVANRTPLRNEQGVEAYYSAALTPWALVTPDIQYVHGAAVKKIALLPADRKDIDDSITMGLRLQLLF